MTRYAGKTVVITGGASGIGEGLVSKFAAEGAAIGLIDVLDSAARKSVAAIKANGGRAVFAHADISSYDEVCKAVAAINDALGDIDVLVNNAGMYAGESFADTSLEDWEMNINTNLLGTYKMTRAVLPQMVANGRGSIVIVSSVNALLALGCPAYSAAKAGLISLGQSLATEYAKNGIRTNTILPGSVPTKAWDIRAIERPDVFDTVKAWYPGGNLGKPEDIAYAAMFLASDEARFINGANLVVDGGLTAGNHRMIADISGT